MELFYKLSDETYKNLYEFDAFLEFNKSKEFEGALTRENAEKLHEMIKKAKQTHEQFMQSVDLGDIYAI
ncbi:hypothetical protein [Taylorella asinigenitalis]|uniref:Uncharacterized protein n=1 Tax=Taylorella asinigenitalis (strain MCE3) TaxID=1008459 RepID=G4QCR7_TAYAM|nr:hypothetical protein [Taylorella asinigenitalis]AEP36197.1 hypothetical protein TASI_0422 [Taylorella asinigenitalis MCE3]